MTNQLSNGGVSIIITTCNRDKDVLQRAIESALNQTYLYKEIIIVNDYPPMCEQIQSLIQEIQSGNIYLLQNEKQRGACYSRNRGLQESRGEFIALLDDDDEWMPDKIEKQVNRMQEDTVMVYCNYVAKSPDFPIKQDTSRKFPEGNILNPLLANNFIGGCSIPLFRKDAALKCGGFDEAFQSCQDYDMWLRISKFGNVMAVKEVLSVYYVWNTSITGNFERRIAGWEKLLEKHKSDYDKNTRQKLKFQSIMINESVKHNRMEYARNQLNKSFHFFPKNIICIYMFGKGILQRILKIY
ncbi:MAG: glycosyltransferase family 2 protein [Lachnospiraceae bacterium]|nr:glycosyltransferase family 2 protein [Lachnospiraceae bacterium]